MIKSEFENIFVREEDTNCCVSVGKLREQKQYDTGRLEIVARTYSRSVRSVPNKNRDDTYLRGGTKRG